MGETELGLTGFFFPIDKKAAILMLPSPAHLICNAALARSL
jgi:hypothetical protein